MTKKPNPPGPASLFRGKVRKPVSLTLTPSHHKKVDDSTQRLGLSRADLIGLLIDEHAETVRRRSPAYRRLVAAVATLGGSIDYEPWNGPNGAAWVLSLGGRRLTIEKPFTLLAACYRPQPAVPAGQEQPDEGEIDPAGLAELFRHLALNGENAG